MTFAVLTPFTASEAVELGNRTWWKRLLPIGEIDYKGRRLKFTRDYLAGLKSAFDDKAYDQTAFQLADAQNTHTNDPDRFRGEIAEMDVRGDGLWVRLSPTDAGDRVLQENPRLGVSARIVEDYSRADGKHYRAAIQHVLGTLDPRIPGLGGWQAVEAASPVPDELIDLSAETFAGEPAPTAPAPTAPDVPGIQQQVRTDGMADLSALTDAQKERLIRLLDLPEDQLDALAAGGTVLTPDELDALVADDDEDELADEIAGMTDEELADIEAQFEAAEAGTEPDPEGEPVSAGLSAEAQFEINLANARQEETARELAVVTARLREEDYLAERRRLADLGVPPHITDLARPLLEGAGHAVELANGRTVDAGGLMRRVLTEYARQARLLDLSTELGSAIDEPDDDGVLEQQATDRDALVARYKNVTGLK